MAEMTDDERLPPAFFFIHVMKTAGGTFREHLHEHFGKEACFPTGKYDSGNRYEVYMQLDRLRNLPVERHRRLKAYSGHFPYCATSYVDRALITATILRDPVERIVSYLRDAVSSNPMVRGSSYEEIYDHWLLGPCLIRNHQAKVFAMTDDDEPESVLTVVDIDDDRLALAKRRLAEIDIVGRQENFGAFLSAVSERLGWDGDVDVADQHRGQGEEVSPALRRRIRDDNAADIEFYEHALGLMAERGTI